MIRIRSAFLSPSLIVSLMATAGCNNHSPSSASSLPINPPTASTGSFLTRAQSCDDLLDRLQGDAIEKINVRVDANLDDLYEEARRQRAGEPAWGSELLASPGSSSARNRALGNDLNNSAPSSASSEKATDGATTGASSSSSNSESSSPPASGPASTYSETNTQVKGVDEADIVKNDGQYIYVLRGREFFVVNGRPAKQIARTATLVVEGRPLDMFVADGKAIIYSMTNGVSLYEDTGTPLSKTSLDAYDGYVQSMMQRVPQDSRNPSPPFFLPVTKITVVTLENNQPKVISERYVEGNYVSSRRVDAKTYTVMSTGPRGPSINVMPSTDDYFGPQPATLRDGDTSVWVDQQAAAWERARTRAIETVNRSVLADWLPPSFQKVDGKGVRDPFACDSYYVPPAGVTENGAVQVHALDWTHPEVLQTTSVIGKAEIVYANGNALYASATSWERPRSFRWYQLLAGPAQSSVVHKFALHQAATPSYEASGSVPGYALNQFSLDEKDGYLRIATTEDRIVKKESNEPITHRSWSSERANHVYALESQDGQLSVVGDVGDLAKNERIYSTRFVGDKAYVVTFLQKDPLFTLDVSNPRSLRVLGKLEIPGFSNYMHPLDAGHLLTVGQETKVSTRDSATPATDPAPRATDLALQIFDVTSATQPKLAHKLIFDPSIYFADNPNDPRWRQSGSKAQYDHKSFTFYPEKGLLAIPFYADGPCKETSPDPRSSSAHCSVTTLELFSVSTSAGIRRLGGVDHSAMVEELRKAAGYCNENSYRSSRWNDAFGNAFVKRGVFLDNDLYSISDGGIQVHQVDGVTPLASVTFPFDPNVYSVAASCGHNGNYGGNYGHEWFWR